MHQTAVSRALDPVNFGYRRQALDVVHCEDRGTVHHSMNDHSVFRGINVGHMLIALHLKMKRRWRDESYRILKGSQSAEPLRTIYTVYANSFLVLRTPAVYQVIHVWFVDCITNLRVTFTDDQTRGHARECFATGERDRSCSQAGQSRAALQKPPAIGHFGIHNEHPLSNLFPQDICSAKRVRARSVLRHTCVGHPSQCRLTCGRVQVGKASPSLVLIFHTAHQTRQPKACPTKQIDPLSEYLKT